MSSRSAAFDRHTIAQEVADEFPDEIKGKYGADTLFAVGLPSDGRVKLRVLVIQLSSPGFHLVGLGRRLRGR